MTHQLRLPAAPTLPAACTAICQLCLHAISSLAEWFNTGEVCPLIYKEQISASQSEQTRCLSMREPAALHIMSALSAFHSFRMRSVALAIHHLHIHVAFRRKACKTWPSNRLTAIARAGVGETPGPPSYLGTCAGSLQEGAPKGAYRRRSRRVPPLCAECIPRHRSGTSPTISCGLEPQRAAMSPSGLQGAPSR
jgi:hypothetical protein